MTEIGTMKTLLFQLAMSALTMLGLLFGVRVGACEKFEVPLNMNVPCDEELQVPKYLVSSSVFGQPIPNKEMVNLFSGIWVFSEELVDRKNIENANDNLFGPLFGDPLNFEQAEICMVQLFEERVEVGVTSWDGDEFKLLKYAIFPRKLNGDVLLFCAADNDTYLFGKCIVKRGTIVVHLPETRKVEVDKQRKPVEARRDDKLMLWQPDLNTFEVVHDEYDGLEFEKKAIVRLSKLKVDGEMMEKTK